MESQKVTETYNERVMSFFARLFVWALLFATLYVLRSFFLLVFLTFVFAYLQESAVERLAPVVASRNKRVVYVALCLLSVLLFLGSFLIPRFREQATNFAQRMPSYISTLDQGISDIRERYPKLKEMLPTKEVEQDGTLESPATLIVQQFIGLPQKADGKTDVKGVVSTVRDIGGAVLGIISAFLLSLLFSFLIVLDLPKLTASARALAGTKVGFIYDEVSDSIYDFALVMGRALEAQVYIALCNTALTAIGVFFLGLGDQVAFLAVIVFICSFIPVAGVFISSVPICLLALQDSGAHAMLAAVVLITVIHFIEAYILNPRIYGHSLRMNPVIVLIILTVMGKLFHVWGLILGVPIFNYVFNHAIRYQRPHEVDETTVDVSPT